MINPKLQASQSIVHPDGTMQAYFRDFLLQLFQVFVGAGYGGLNQSVATAITLTSGWTTVPADQALLSTPRLVEQQIASDGVVLEQGGIWMWSVNLLVAHDVLASGRTMGIRLFNVTDSVVIATFDYAIAQNQPATNINTVLPVEIPDTDTGDLLVLQLSALADTFSAVTVRGGFNLANTSGLVGAL